MDRADSETAAERCRERLVPVDTQIADLEARRELALLRAALDAAIAARDLEVSRTGGRMRAASLALRDAAVEFTAAIADERDAVDYAERLAAEVTARALALGEPGAVVQPAPRTTLWVHGDLIGAEPVALSQAISEARIGRARAVAVRLAESWGWLPPSPEELAAERERMLQLLQPQSPPPPSSVTHPEHWPASVGIDHHGRPLLPRPIRPNAPSFTGWPR